MKLHHLFSLVCKPLVVQVRRLSCLSAALCLPTQTSVPSLLPEHAVFFEIFGLFPSLLFPLSGLYFPTFPFIHNLPYGPIEMPCPLLSLPRSFSIITVQVYSSHLENRYFVPFKVLFHCIIYYLKAEAVYFFIFVSSSTDLDDGDNRNSDNYDGCYLSSTSSVPHSGLKCFMYLFLASRTPRNTLSGPLST